MQKQTSPSLSRFGSLAAATLLALPFSASLHAQEGTVQTPPVSSSPSVAQPFRFDLQAALHTPIVPAFSESSSSSSVTADPGANSPGANLVASPAADGNGQPPPYRRRRYGQPSYNDRWHNADGSNRIAVVAGGGFNIPTGSASSNYLNTNWRAEVGGGINFSRKLAVLLQFDYDNFGIPGNILGNQENLYSTLDPTDGAQGAFQGLDGHTHVWSLTLNPTFNFYQGEKIGSYAVVGTGFYHKNTEFTVPSIGEYCDYIYGCYEYQANQPIDGYNSNAIGVTGGIGLTYKFSRFANQKFFAEARFVRTFNSARLGDPIVTGAPNGTTYNLYPPNSNETSYIPITFGIRF